MIDVIVLYLTTIVIAIIINKIHELSIVKDLADNNYKLNLDNVDNINKINDNNNVYLYIPIYNIAKSISNFIEYKNDYFFLTAAYSEHLVKEFSTMEKKMYKKHPNIINANMLEYKMYLKKKFAHQIVVDNSLIYFNLSTAKGLELVESEGKLSYESENKQTHILYNAIEKSLDEVVEKNINEVDDKDEYIKQIEMTKEYLRNVKNNLEEQKNIKKLIKTK